MTRQDLRPLTHTAKISPRISSRQRKETRPSIDSSHKQAYFSGMFCGSHYELKFNGKVKVIAVDFDGTLAQLFEPYDPRRAGPPLGPDDPKSIFNMTKKLVRKHKVVVLTARMNSKEHTPAQLKYTSKLIAGWTKKYLGVSLPCTSEKHHSMQVIYDDRAIAIDPKTGRIK
jgi:hypothetical protein